MLQINKGKRVTRAVEHVAQHSPSVLLVQSDPDLRDALALACGQRRALQEQHVVMTGHAVYGFHRTERVDERRVCSQDQLSMGQEDLVRYLLVATAVQFAV